MTDNNRCVGKKGEAVALAFLKNKGFIIERTNFRTSLGEIDIIARDKATLVFVEVKTRQTIKYGLPYEAVQYQKQAKIRQVALQFLATQAGRAKDFRFDVVSVLWSAAGLHKIDHIINAF